ncbi:mucin-5AC [Oreochromis niloticus]|uniref:mucin-5AC n=1 Tax=Oreochromis niloticus TaxID=8128 RepID=UPI000DF2881E|nr:mucin-5AC [Oreochromis niloticus]
MFDLAGESDGYIAATLSRNTQGVNDTTYICANNNGVVKFFSALLNNGKLTLTTLKVNTVRGKVSGKKIQCQFAATVPDSTSTTTRADTSTTSFSVSVSNGTYNASSEDLGSPTAKITTGVVDLANVNSTTTTTAPSNTTAAPSNTTAAPSNTTTAPPNTTAAPTTPAPLVPDTNVTTLNASITRTECGRKQLCAAQPRDCDPSNGTCFFLGAQALGGQNFMFDLAGESDGYIAATLSRNTQGVNDTTYICANNNGVVKFFSALLNNGKLTLTTLKVNTVRGKVSGKKIQCQFAATVPDSNSTTTRAETSTTSFSVSVSNGTYNATSEDLGSPTAQIRTGVVDLANVNATTDNQINATTTTAPSNTTAAPTTPAPLVPDSTVTTLNTSLTKDNCSKTQLCVSQPSGCDPSSGTCFFLGAQQLGGQNFRFSLAGQSDGYVALTLSRNTTPGTNDTTYICANNNGVVKFFSALLNNGKLTLTPLNVNTVRGKVSGKNIQCQFDATVPDSTSTKTRADTSTTSFSMSVSNGTYNAASDSLGSPVFQIRTNVVELGNVNATINNQINSNTTAPSNTTAAPTIPAPLVPDSNVTIVNTSITRDNCSKTQLCVSQPSGCDPSSGTCFFLGAQQLGGQNFRFSLAGQSDGYVALILSRNTTPGVNDTTYICANNNSVVKYISALLNNGKLTRTTLKVNTVRGKVSGKNIQCQFAATVPDSTSTTTRADTSTTSFSMSVSTGTYNASSDGLGSPTAKITTGVVDLANVNATINNQINSNTTAPPNTTAAPTTPAPLVPDTNVTILNASITRTECGRKQLCAAQPSGCDPSNGTCFFLGAQALGGQNFMFDLAGESDGYIAATLSRNTQGVNDTTYICANNNGVVKFFSALLNNGKLTRTPLKVNNVRGKVSGKNIQCQFAATVPDSTSTTTRADTSTTSFSMSVSTGTYNASSDGLGSPTAKITTGVVDLANVMPLSIIRLIPTPQHHQHNAAPTTPVTHGP